MLEMILDSISTITMDIYGDFLGIFFMMLSIIILASWDDKNMKSLLNKRRRKISMKKRKEFLSSRTKFKVVGRCTGCGRFDNLNHLQKDDDSMMYFHRPSFGCKHV